jgi:nitrous oxidase accessory protein NosD
VLSDTLIVSAKGDAGYISIEDALSAAGRGSNRAKRILLRPGRYVLNGTVAIDRAVSILGIGPRANVIVESGGGPCFVLSGTGGLLRGLTIKTATGSAVIIRGDVTIEDCDITSPGTAVDVQVDADARLRHCRIHDSRGTGLLLGRSAEVRVESCTIAGNALGILVQQNARLVLLKSQVLRSRSGSGITVQGLGRVLVSGCDVSDNRKSGVALEEGIAEIRDSRINKNRWYAVNCAGGNGSVNISGSTFVGNFPADIHPLCAKSAEPALTQ